MSATKTFTPPFSPPPPQTNRRSSVETTPDVATNLPVSSTLIEFPGRAPRPQWRKDLSLRVREIQERRAREGKSTFAITEYASSTTRDFGSPAMIHDDTANHDGKQPPLGLVPSTPPPPLNPIVARALERIERARQNASPAPPPTNLHIAQSAHPPPTPTILDFENDAVRAEPSPALSIETSDAHTAEESTPDPTRESTSEAACIQTPAALHTNENSSATESISAPVVTTTTTINAADVSVVTPAAGQAASFISDIAPEQTTSHKQTIVHPKPAVQHSPAAITAASPSIQIPASREQVKETSDTKIIQAKETSGTKTITAMPTPESSPRLPRRVVECVIDDAVLARREREAFESEEAARRNSLDDRAAITSRVVASLVDFAVVAFLLSPVAATVELAYGNWMDARVWYVMTSAAALLMFLYSSAATAFAGRTLGQRMLSVRPVEVSTGLSPSVSQAVKRAAFWVISFGALGLGLLYALADSERRGIHDHLSGTIVVGE